MTGFLITGRRTGKTTAAVQWVNEAPGRVLVTANAVETGWVRREFFPDENPLHPEKVFPYSSVTAGRLRGRAIRELAVDNLDHMFMQIFGLPVGLITATGEYEYPMFVPQTWPSWE